MIAELLGAAKIPIPSPVNTRPIINNRNAKGDAVFAMIPNKIRLIVLQAIPAIEKIRAPKRSDNEPTIGEQTVIITGAIEKITPVFIMEVCSTRSK